MNHDLEPNLGLLRRFFLVPLAWAGFLLGSVGAPAPGVAGELPKPEFNRDIRPLLSDHCYQCHGPDKNRRKAKLRLDERASALANGAIVPGKPDESKLVTRISSQDKHEMMPPPEANKPLSASQRDLLRRWISAGAEYQPHWAYATPRRPEIPSVHQKAWVRNPIDAFVLAMLEAKGVRPSPEADRRTLLRRLSLDLNGLPPTPEEVERYVADTDPRAYEHVVDRLLDSPHYGERMAVPWLDLARFADTVGYHGDQNQDVFPYRDYVIEAFNRNKRFDQFTIEQLAGDLLPHPTPEQRIATGFNRLNMMTREGGAQPKEYLAKYAADRVRTVSETWLGSTMGCCECHDHKFDPFKARDFYSLAAFFADVKQWGVYQDYDYTPNPDLKGWSNDHPFPPEIEVASPYLQRRQERLQGQIRQLVADTAGRLTTDEPQRTAFAPWQKAAYELLKQAPDGWLTPPAQVPGNAEVTTQKDGSLLVAGKASRNGEFKVQLRAPATWLAAVRLELLPDESHQGKITRDGTDRTFVRLAAAVRPTKTTQETKLAFRDADADFKELRYVNGASLLGVTAGWRTLPGHARSTQRSVWLLDSPVQLAEGDELHLTVKSDNVGRFRLSIAPFAPDDPRQPLVDDLLRQALEAKPEARTAAQTERLHMAYLLGTAWDTAAFTRFKALQGEVRACRDGRAMSMVTEAWAPRPGRVLPRGNWQDESGEPVVPAVPHFLPQPANPDGRRLTRLDLAHWLMAPENPLTARVFVNRLWKQLFGTGLSAVMEDVGAQGEWPIHPELLDWLAVEFRTSGWDVKHVVRLLVTSAAYRQDSRQRPELRDLDPGNRLVAAQSPRRLEAEFVRDNALAIAGLINLDLGGPSVHPYQPAGYYANIQFPDRTYVPEKDDRQYRRGLYMHWQRTFLHPMLANFDAPAREECTASRNVANTPQQALTLLNDPTFVEAARVLAQRLRAASLPTDDARFDWLFQRALARPAKAKEKQSLAVFLDGQRAAYRATPEAARQLLHVGQTPPPLDGDDAELAAWTSVCRVVLNLHETITRY